MDIDPLVSRYLESHPAAAAGVLHQLGIDELAEFLGKVNTSVIARVLPHLKPATCAEVLHKLDIKDAAEILVRMPNEAAVLVMRAMNRDRHYSFYREMPRSAALRLRLQMQYPQALVGSLVDSEVLTLQPDQRVSDALRLTRTRKTRIPQQIYIVNNERRLVGYVDLTMLISNRERTPISRIRRKVPLVLNTRSPINVAEELDAWLNFDSLPVVDRSGSFQGVLRREAITRKDHLLLQGISSEREFNRTRSALADIFWLVTGSLLVSKSTSKTLDKRDY